MGQSKKQKCFNLSGRKMIWKSNFTKALKISFAVILAIITANLLELQYAVTAGIITILSIQNTKRETLKTARNRGLAFVCALFLSAICYKILGFTVPAFITYLFLFTMVCLTAKWNEAIAMDSVLISHFLSEEQFDSMLLFNEVMLFVIGTSFGILINLILRKKEQEFERLAAEVDEEIKGIIHRMSVYLCVEDKTEYKSDCFFRFVEKIDKAKVCALQNWNNTLWKTTAYEMDYIKMRENQSRVLANIYQSIIMIKILPKQTAQVADFLQHIEQQYHRNNNVTKLLDKLEEMLAYMKEEPLPQDRAEFEARAVLFYMLKQLEEFLYLKNQFILKYNA